MGSRGSRIRTFVLSALLAGAGGCGPAETGPPLGTLLEGVAGPFIGLYGELTKLGNADYVPYDFSEFYIQAVVNNVRAGDTVTARLTPDNVSRTFTAEKDSDVGLSFNFDPGGGHWTPGRSEVTVTHGGRTVGSVYFNIKD